jgi:hypothetical protein
VGARGLLGVFCSFRQFNGKKNWVKVYSRDEEFVSEVIIVGLCRGEEATRSDKFGLVIVLSSGAHRPSFFVLSCS